MIRIKSLFFLLSVFLNVLILMHICICIQILNVPILKHIYVLVYAQPLEIY